MKNKKAMQLTLLLIPLLTLVLFTLTLFYFALRENEIKNEVNTALLLNDIYDKELRINYYLKNIFEESVNIFENNQNNLDSMHNYISESLKQIKDPSVIPEIEYIKNKLKKEDITLNEASISWKVNVEIYRVYQEDFDAKYTYTKEFSKNIQEKQKDL
ncbi:MAG: hypothetical protein ACP5OG_04825 [Candidatus Nanoarchaeia archaeon]